MGLKVTECPVECRELVESGVRRTDVAQSVYQYGPLVMCVMDEKAVRGGVCCTLKVETLTEIQWLALLAMLLGRAVERRIIEDTPGVEDLQYRLDMILAGREDTTLTPW